MKKDFRIARKPGQATASEPAKVEAEPVAVDKPPRERNTPAKAPRARVEPDRSTRKTIEVPEGYFFQVKLMALQRRMKEKDIWAEILEEYFRKRPL